MPLFFADYTKLLVWHFLVSVEFFEQWDKTFGHFIRKALEYYASSLDHLVGAGVHDGESAVVIFDQGIAFSHSSQ